MALRALAALWPLAELSAVRVGCMAVGAFRMRHRLLEVALEVALFARNLTVFSKQWEACLCVIKLSCHAHLFPGNGVMAALAGCRERALMRIGMAGCAIGEGKSPVFYIRPGSLHADMALLASHALVRASERVLRFGVIELRHALPVREGVTGGAVFAQLADVLVDVAAQTIPCKSQERPVQIFNDDVVPLRCGDMLRRVALFAAEARMAPFQRVSRLVVVEGLKAGLPVDQAEIHAIVLRMAGDTRLTGGIFYHHLRVETPVCGDVLANVGMTFKALQFWRAYTESVAFRALRWSAQGSVCLR